MKNTDVDEQDIARLIRAGGPRERLPENLKKPWGDQFRREIKPVIKRRKQRVRIVFGACATATVLAITVLLSPGEPRPKPIDIEVVSVIGIGEVLLKNETPKPLSEGLKLGPGSTINTGDNGYVAISYEGYDLRLNTSTIVEILEDGVALKTGELYVNNEFQAVTQHSFTVQTALGKVSDIGTQFSVSLYKGELQASVRRGIIVLENSTGKYRAEATRKSGSRIVFNGATRVAVQEIEHGGKEWNWVYHSGPDFTLEGHSAHDFLLWSTREAGLDIEYATKSAEIYARTTILHGELNSLNPQQAISPVLATTHLRSEHASPRTIRVSLLTRD